MPRPSFAECLQATFLIANKQTYRVSETRAPGASASASGSIGSCWQLTDTHVLQRKGAPGKRELCGITLLHKSHKYGLQLLTPLLVIFVKPQSRNNKIFTPLFDDHM